MLFAVVPEFTKSYIDHLNVMSRGLKMVGNAVHLREEGGQKR